MPEEKFVSNKTGIMTEGESLNVNRIFLNIYTKGLFIESNIDFRKVIMSLEKS